MTNYNHIITKSFCIFRIAPGIRSTSFKVAHMASYRVSNRSQVVFVRHGESEWNQKGRFCGWYDSPLTRKGKRVSADVGRTLRDYGFQFDEVHTSVLWRAYQTLKIILDEVGQSSLKVFKSWRLNERHYGDLTGLYKKTAIAIYGERQIAIWGKGFNSPPPPIDISNKYYYRIHHSPRYEREPVFHEFPNTESLKMVIERTLPYWYTKIVPSLSQGKTILIVGHHHLLRGLVKHLDGIPDKGIERLIIPNSAPFLYEFDAEIRPISTRKYLGSPEILQSIENRVAQLNVLDDIL